MAPSPPAGGDCVRSRPSVTWMTPRRDDRPLWGGDNPDGGAQAPAGHDPRSRCLQISFGASAGHVMPGVGWVQGLRRDRHEGVERHDHGGCARHASLHGQRPGAALRPPLLRSCDRRRDRQARSGRWSAPARIRGSLLSLPLEPRRGLSAQPPAGRRACGQRPCASNLRHDPVGDRASRQRDKGPTALGTLLAPPGTRMTRRSRAHAWWLAAGVDDVRAAGLTKGRAVWYPVAGIR